MTELVTGEAVVLELRLARFASRLIARAIDAAIQFALLLVGLVVVTGVTSAVDSALRAAVILVFVVLVLVGYPVAFETLTRGRSPGKMAMGLRVVREDGGPIRFRQALVRGLLGTVEIYVSSGSVALIASLASARGKRVGDYLAGTVVVRERTPTQAAPMAVMPPQLAGWAASLDLSAVPDDLALAARQFLARAGELSPEAREQIGNRLAGALASVTRPPPPPGVPTWAFLAAVVAERRRRETLRLSGRATTTGGREFVPGPGATTAPFAAAPKYTPVPYAAPPAPGNRPSDNPFAPPG